MIFQLLGGIGLFLMGMILLTEGLKSFAGEALRKILIRFAGSPLKALGSGALLTAVVQSSSATTVTVIGFVSAGLLTFSQSLGVVIGASLGTTTTGWIVSVLGLKISIGFYALPIVGIGAFLRLLASGRWKPFGWALAGFGLIFIGIETLQTGMTDLAANIKVAQLPEAGLLAHFLAMLAGVLLTIIMQSSSAAVATTLTALHTGTVNFEQAASLLIGSAIGTTVTGVIAAIGGSVSAKRTALAHVTFNLITGIIAIVLLPLLIWIIRLAQQYLSLEPGAVSLAAFHSTFIALGVVLFFPFLKQFAAWVERVLPEVENASLRHLDSTVLHVPSVALEVTRRALCETACETFQNLHNICNAVNSPKPQLQESIKDSIDQIQAFFASIPADGSDRPISYLRINQVHAIEHLIRLQKQLTYLDTHFKYFSDPKIRPGVELTLKLLKLGETGLIAQGPEGWLKTMELTLNQLSQYYETMRSETLQQAARAQGPMSYSIQALDSLRWLEQISHHTWRISNYLGNNEPSPSPEDLRTSDRMDF